jgi:hypothetical protein
VSSRLSTRIVFGLRLVIPTSPRFCLCEVTPYRDRVRGPPVRRVDGGNARHRRAPPYQRTLDERRDE